MEMMAEDGGSYFLGFGRYELKVGGAMCDYFSDKIPKFFNMCG